MMRLQLARGSRQLLQRLLLRLWLLPLLRQSVLLGVKTAVS